MPLAPETLYDVSHNVLHDLYAPVLLGLYDVSSQCPENGYERRQNRTKGQKLSRSNPCRRKTDYRDQISLQRSSALQRRLLLNS
jgi:hypothetical protein